MGRLGSTWDLMKSSWEVLKKDKEILMFPVFSSVASLLVVASFIAPIVISPQSFGFGGEEGGSGSIVGYLYMFLFYVCSYFVVIFFNTALVACAVKRMRGGDPTVAYGLKEALGRIGAIFGWAVIAGTVGMIIKMIEERVGFVGQIVMAIIGGVWTLVAFFVIPVLVVEKVGPVKALKESASLLKKTWGEQLMAHFSFGLLGLLCAIPGIILVFIGFATLQNIGVFLLVAAGLYLLLLSLVFSALSSIFQAALYLYAKEGSAGDLFSNDALSGTIGPKG